MCCCSNPHCAAADSYDVLQERQWRQITQHQVEQLLDQLTQEHEVTEALKLQLAQAGSDRAGHEQVAKSLQQSRDECDAVREMHRQLGAEGSNWVQKEAALEADLDAAINQISELAASAKVPLTGYCEECVRVAQAYSLWVGVCIAPPHSVCVWLVS